MKKREINESLNTMRLFCCIGHFSTNCMEMRRPQFETAIYALEKQMPKKPTAEIANEETGVITEAECPDCGALVVKCMSYCCKCGQALKW